VDRTGARPVASPVRWGLGDFCWIYLPLPLLALLGKLAGGDSSDASTESATALTVAITAGIQYLYWGGGLWFVSRRKGRGSLEADFGVTVQTRRMWALVGGVGLQIALGLLVLPLVRIVDNDQAVVEEIRDSSGAKLVVLVVIAGFVAPLLEEVLFRGLLLRSLRRRVSVEWAIAISAFLFASAHLVDLSMGSLAIVPALFALGLISGYAAVRTGDLSVSIPLHMGFNLLTIALLI